MADKNAQSIGKKAKKGAKKKKKKSRATKQEAVEELVSGRLFECI